MFKAFLLNITSIQNPHRISTSLCPVNVVRRYIVSHPRSGSSAGLVTKSVMCTLDAAIQADYTFTASFCLMGNTIIIRVLSATDRRQRLSHVSPLINGVRYAGATPGNDCCTRYAITSYTVMATGQEASATVINNNYSSSSNRRSSNSSSSRRAQPMLWYALQITLCTSLEDIFDC